MTLFSYSRINSFLTCPAQYQHRYLLKTPSPVPEGVELFMGSRFHEAMEFLYDPARPFGQYPPSLEEVLKVFHDQWNEAMEKNVKKQHDRGFDQPIRITREGMTLEDYRLRATSFVENYYRKYHPFNQDRTEAIEMKVVFKLDQEGRYRMQGYIDRLAVDSEGTLWIHDYKTGQKKMSAEEARNEDQLALYMLGLKQHEKYRELAAIRMAWHFVAFEDDEVVSDRKPEELKTLRNRYVHHIQQIESAKQFNTRTCPLCGWCEFMTVCADGKAYVEARAKRQAPQEETPAFAKVPSLPPRPGAEEPVVPEKSPSSRGRKNEPHPNQLSLFG